MALRALTCIELTCTVIESTKLSQILAEIVFAPLAAWLRYLACPEQSGGYEPNVTDLFLRGVAAVVPRWPTGTPQGGAEPELVADDLSSGGIASWPGPQQILASLQIQPAGSERRGGGNVSPSSDRGSSEGSMGLQVQQLVSMTATLVEGQQVLQQRWIGWKSGRRQHTPIHLQSRRQVGLGRVLRPGIVGMPTLF